MRSLQISGNTEHNTTQPKPSKNLAMMCVVDSSENPILWAGEGSNKQEVWPHKARCVLLKYVHTMSGKCTIFSIKKGNLFLV